MTSIISVENLSKAYRIGLKEEAHDTLVGTLQGALRAPFKNFRRLSRLNTYGANGDDAPDTLWALKDVSFEVQEGEVLGVIGRNGAGKSTLLKILSRITEPTSGRAVLRGRVSSLLEVGTGFHPDLSGRDNIYLNGTILGMTKKEIDRKFDEIVDFSGVEKFLDTPVKRYSSGMKVRLAFAVAAHLEPEILIIDEVLAVGDAEFQKKCMGKMKDVARGGRTVIFVSHNFAAIEALCSSLIEMRAGLLTNRGNTASVLAAYRRSLSPKSSRSNTLDGARFIRNVQLMDEAQLATQHIPLGGEFNLQMSIEGVDGLEGLIVGVGIDDSVGQRMLTVHSPPLSINNGRSQPLTSICCSIRAFPLALGDYRIKLAVAHSQKQLDSLDDVLSFSVIDANAFGEGRGFHRGVCVAPSKWNVESGND